MHVDLSLDNQNKKSYKFLTYLVSIYSFFFFVSNIFAFGLFLDKTQVFYFLKLLLVSLSAKLITLFLFAYPATIFCYFLKRAEGIDIYDHGLNFNPFQKMSIANSLS